MSAYAEFAVTSNFSFLRGASRPQELVGAAKALGLAAIGVADRNSLAGNVRAHAVAKELQMPFRVGTRLVTTDGFETLCYPTDLDAYARLSRLLTKGNRRAVKGECHLTLEEIAAASDGQIFIVMTPEKEFSALADAAKGRVYIALVALYGSEGRRRMAEMAEIARRAGLALVAVNDVHYHVKERQILQDVLTCIREKTTIAEAGFRLAANAERYLKSPEDMARLFAAYPDAITRTLDIAERTKGFSLDQVGAAYRYPTDGIGGDPDPQKALERLTWAGAGKAYPDGIPEKIAQQLRHELALIAGMEYAPYFLTVWDIVEFAKSQDILCQGRGSAANSAVCYVLGITAVDPMKMSLLFERFISNSRGEPPDIDVDFEHERREEVIQYIYRKYGRDRAAIAATVISYRSKSAIRDVGKALGLSLNVVGALADNLWGWGEERFREEHLSGIGLDAKDPTLKLAIGLARELHGFPRHLSQHVGGFIIADKILEDHAPIGNAAMDDRTFVEWDKDDLETLKIMKVDVLALGMLTCIAKAFAMLRQHYGIRHTLWTVPQDDEAVYAMLQKADSVGVFQVESRAQMSMLPRLKPKEFQDLIVEVAIVRPGPIQGDMVHPYLRRREGKEEPDYPSEELKDVLGMTLGVPIFQEQAMQIAIKAAGFTPEEADQLRRSMATFKRSGSISAFRDKFINGMLARNYPKPYAERCFQQIEGFAEYGFPMSHAASFAVLVYISAWLKCHYPEVFCAALLNAQPMGFYQPAQLVRDAREHGVRVLPPDINTSAWDNILVQRSGKRCALRLGFCEIKGFRKEDAENLVAARGHGAFDGVRHLALASRLSGAGLSALAHADAFRSLGLDRRQALWAVKGLDGGAENARVHLPELPLFRQADPERLRHEEEVKLPPMLLGEHIVHDYMTLHLSLKSHPLSLLRNRLAARGIIRNAALAETADGAKVQVSGLVLVRQRPGTASGVIFATLEDETGIANAIIWPAVFDAYRRTLLTARLLAVHGRLQRQGLVKHVIAEHLEDLSSELDLLLLDRTEWGAPSERGKDFRRKGPRVETRSRDFH
jgi:error-prone DNA polymerase